MAEPESEPTGAGPCIGTLNLDADSGPGWEIPTVGTAAPLRGVPVLTPVRLLVACAPRSVCLSLYSPRRGFWGWMSVVLPGSRRVAGPRVLWRL